MARPVSNIETLIVKATNPLNQNDDPNLMQKICQAVTTEPSGMQTAIQLIAHKMQSPNEWEAMQTLVILQSCVNNCGKTFHSEVGKFKFLNEMIKIVSPNYLGNQRQMPIKKRICQLLYTWTIDISHEPKINDAYQMLKNQKIIQEDPPYMGVLLPPEKKTKIQFNDEEKSKHLQQLLQSKKPEDVLEANALIKKIVRDDERKIERSSRISIEVETATNNARVLDEIITQYERSCGDADLDLMSELNDSCTSIQTAIYRHVADLNDKEEGIGDLLMANDELSRVMGRYKLKIKGAKSHTNLTKVESKSTDEVALLNVQSEATNNISKEESPKLDTLTSCPAEKIDDIVAKNELELISILDHSVPPLESPLPAAENECSLSDLILVPDKPNQVVYEDDELAAVNPLYGIDLLGSSIIKQNLPPNSCQLGAQFKTKEKVSLNQLKCQQIQASQVTPSSSILIKGSDSSSKHISTDTTENVLNLSLVNNDVSSIEQVSTNPLNNHDEILANLKLIDVPSNSQQINNKAELYNEQNNEIIGLKSKNFNDIDIQLVDIIPDDSRPPTDVINSNLMKVSVHHTLNKPMDNITVMVVTTTSKHPTAVCNYNLHVICPEGCLVRLFAPSSTSFTPFKPFLPSPVITQILLCANLSEVTDDALRLILKYKIGEKTQADFGELNLIV